MNSHINQLHDSPESSCLLKEIKTKIEAESKCQICWELSIGPIICSHCGNNIGCSNCVNKLFKDHHIPSAKCPLCTGEWQRAPKDPANSSLWTGHCPNRALAGILSQINQSATSATTAKSSSPPSAPLKSVLKPSFPPKPLSTPKPTPTTKPTPTPKPTLTAKRRPYRNFPEIRTSENEEDKHKFMCEAHKFLVFRYVLLLPLLIGHICLVANLANSWKLEDKNLQILLLVGIMACLCAVFLHLILLSALWDSFYEAKELNQIRKITKLVELKMLYTILDLISILFTFVFLVASNWKVLQFVGLELSSPTQFVVHNFFFVCFLLAYEGVIAFVSVDNLPIMFPRRDRTGEPSYF